MKALLFLATLKEVLGPESRAQFYVLLLLVVGNACLQALSVASIMPVTAAMISPGFVETNAILNKMFIFLGFKRGEDFTIFLAVLAFASISLAQIAKTFTNHQQIKFCSLQQHALSKRLFSLFLNRPYSWFLEQDSAELSKNILSDVNQVINGVLLPSLLALSQIVTVLMLFGLLYAVSPSTAITVLLVFGLLYILIYRAIKPFIEQVGKSHFQANENRHLVISNALSAAKEIKLGAFEKTFIARFSKYSYSYATNYARAQAALQIPRSLVELIAIGGMLLLMLTSGKADTSVISAIPLTALYAFTAYRLMPALQQTYTGYAEVRTNLPALEVVYQRLNIRDLPEQILLGNEPVFFTNEICLSNISFTYPGSLEPAVRDFTLRIKAGSSVAIVGHSGSGKSTLATILTGLLPPTPGLITVDNVPIGCHNLLSWRQLIGYVPQQIFLSNDTVAANIAFGCDAAQVDMAAVEHAARLANLHEFVSEMLPKGYHTVVGERGVRLSGGQRQRIAIARALYNKPRVLILDEATSALDNITERYVMNAINNLPDDITTIVIAHRLSSVEKCTEIVLLDKGRIIGHGDYSELLKFNSSFVSLVKGEG
jgi:ATP-binding cassette, subfamily B, bacterial PglK